MQILFITLVIVSCFGITIAQLEVKFDPNDCYESGTIFEENEKNLGYCPCKYGFHGPFCFQIHDCVIGEMRTENCTQDIKNDYDLQWRCAASKEEIVKICTCPEGFRGETCEFIMENTVSTYWKTAMQSQKFFEVIYNKSDSLVKVIGTKTCRFIIEYRRLIMFVIFVLLLELAWRFTKRQQKQNRLNAAKCHLMGPNDTFNLDNLKNSNSYYYPLPKYDLNSLEEADRLPDKKPLEEYSVEKFTEISETSNDVEVNITENKVIISKPHLHI